MIRFRKADVKLWVPDMYQTSRTRITFAAMLLTLLAACASRATVSPPPAQNPPQPVAKTIPQIPLRVIINFRQPTSDSPQIRSAIARSCHCEPLFLRMDRANVLIYQITLLPSQTFADFERAMRQQVASLEIEFIEQDRLMQHQ